MVDDCDKINPVYMDTRYPDARGGIPYEHYTEERSKEDIDIAKRVLTWLEEKL